MRRAFFFIVAVCLATSAFASIPRASARIDSPSRFDPLPETRIRVSDDLAPFERPAPSLLSRALHQGYEQASTTNASGLAGFLSVDPTWESADLGKPQSWNRYSYVMNNPVNLTDPDGKCPICIDVVVDLLTDGSGLDPEPRPDLTKPLFGGTVTRYMGAGEAEYARRTGYIPNTNAKGVERPTHVTTDEPVDKAKTAKKKYELPVTPTHRATVPEDRVPGGLQPTPDGRPRTSGGGSQSAATRPIPVKESEIVPLKQSAWKTLLKWLF